LQFFQRAPTPAALAPGWHPKENKSMKPDTKDQLQGKFHEVKGKVKEEAGRVTNNPDLEQRGQSEKVAGKVQKKVGEIEKVLEK
jgi:uncharacterized protein YjbJ (UPF0337 family)